MDTKIKSSLKFLLAILALGTPVGFLIAYFLAPYSPKLISPASISRLSPFASILSSVQSTDSGRVLGSYVSGATLSAQFLPQRRVISPPPPPLSSSTVPTSPSDSSTTSSSSSNSGGDSPPSVGNSSSGESQSPGGAQQLVEDLTNLVITYLKGAENQDGVPLDHLYNLMSQDFKATFSEADFVSGFDGSQTVVNGVTVSAPTIYGANNDWAEQTIKLSLADGTTQDYLAVFHFENGGWKLYATQEQ